MIEYPSAWAIDDQVHFTPMVVDQERMGISNDQRYGTIISVQFTKAKVWYYILDDYYGEIFKVDSSRVNPESDGPEFNPN